MDWFDIIKTLIGIKIVSNCREEKYFLRGILLFVVMVCLRGTSSYLSVMKFGQKHNDIGTHIHVLIIMLLLFGYNGYPAILLLSSIGQWKFKCEYFEQMNKLYKFLNSKDRQTTQLKDDLLISKNRCALLVLVIVLVLLTTSLTFDETFNSLDIHMVIYKSLDMCYFKFLYLITVTEVYLYLRNLHKCWKSYNRIMLTLREEL